MNSLNLLVAIPYCSRQILEVIKANDVCFLLDSGAFTAWKKGTTIELSDYIKFIKDLPVKPWRYFTLDKVGDPKGTKANYKNILSEGLKPIPIFTRGDDLKELETYYEHSDLVGIGGLVATRGNKGFVRGIVEKIGNKKIHLLGFVNRNFIPYYRPFSCDTSSFAAGMLYGRLNLYLGQGRWKNFSKEDFISRPSPEIFQVFEEYEEDIGLLQQKAHWRNPANGSVMVKMGFKSWVRYSMDVEKRFGTKLFLAAGCSRDVQFLIDAHSFWKNKSPTLSVCKTGSDHRKKTK